MMRVRPSGVACLAVLVAIAATGIAAPVMPPRPATVEVHASRTVLTFPASDAALPDQVPQDLGAVVALPARATSAQAVLLSGRAEEVAISAVATQRGHQVAVVRIVGPGSGPLSVAVQHDGDWSTKADPRLASPGLAAGLAGAAGPAGDKAATLPAGGSYVIVTAPQYEGALAPLVDWKTRKGWPVRVVTTDETGSSNASIKDWLQVAYATWAVPPEFVLLVGDVDALPSWSFSGNVTDLPYALVDGDDWFPDLMLGRFSVSNQTECAAMVAKTVAYEESPYLDQTNWFTRGVMVAGQSGSTTPKHTVRFCGEQLASIGFEAPDPILPVDLSDPEHWGYNDGNYIVSPLQTQDGFGVRETEGYYVVNDAISAGCGFVVYRGWAYGTAGWDPPVYTVSDIASLENGAMTPVVMSFVCLNGDFSAADVCFGEAFTRTGGATPGTFRGAVAFIGNGEHWSHTRFNDAMAISVFERVVDSRITTLGGLLNAGKLRFLEYFPGELDDQGDEESVEFYFHIYNLLGDPELGFYRDLPTPLQADHPTDLAVGTSLVEVMVTEAGGGAAVAGARVGIAQDGTLLGRALTGADGLARVVLDHPVGLGAVSVTASRRDRLPYLGSANGGQDGAFVALAATNLPAGSVAPGAEVDFTPDLVNQGTEASSSATVRLTLDGPVTVTTATTNLAGLAAGATGAPTTPLAFRIDDEAEDGALVAGDLAVERGAEVDRSGLVFTVSAPDIQLSATYPAGEAWVDAGATTEVALSVTNAGSRDAAGGTIDLAVVAPEGVAVAPAQVTFGALAAGASLDVGTLQVTVPAATPEGQTVTLTASVACTDGATQNRGLDLPLGDGAAGQPVGPDQHGYYAYDSADYLYPDRRPVYHWHEISTAFGGPGTRLAFASDNYDTEVTVDLPFTFRFYGQDFDRVRVSDNGWLSFEDTNDAYNFYNWPLPSEHGNGAVIAPFWDNLNPTPMADPENDPVGLSSDGIYTYHDAAAGEFIVEWSRMRHIKPEIHDLQTFQAVLRDPVVHDTPTGDGEILFYYKQVTDNDHVRMFASVGIESPDEEDGLQLTYDSIRTAGTLTFGPGQAVRVTTAEPERQPLAVSLSRAGKTLSWQLNDPRPIRGWRVHALRGGEKTCLTPEPLAADIRAFVASDDAADLVLEALLPHGVSCEAGKALAGGTELRFALGAPVPNPVQGESAIAFALPRAGHVRVRVFDVRGRLVRTLLDDGAAAGQGVVVWRGRDDQGQTLADGVYFCRLEHGGRTLTRKLLLVH